MLADFQKMVWTIRPFQHGQAPHWADDTWHTPDYSSFFHAGSKEQDFEKVEFDKMFQINIIKLAKSEWASLIEFASAKDISICLFLYWIKLPQCQASRHMQSRKVRLSEMDRWSLHTPDAGRQFWILSNHARRPRRIQNYFNITSGIL